MKKKHVIVLGAGISGLSAAWFLNQSGQPVDVTLIEKTQRAGGLLHTEYTPDFIFEKSARLFKTDKSPELLKLVQALGLQDQIIQRTTKGFARYTYQEGKLRRFPGSPLGFCVSSLTRGFIPALLSEWKKPAKCEDETVWEFVQRRLSPELARTFFDPLVVGIFGGDMREISVRACFPLLKRFEEQHGSILRGLLHHWKNRPRSQLFSFKQGVQQLIDRLLAKSDAECHFGQEVQRIAVKDNKVEVVTQDRIYYGDGLIFALGLKESIQLFEPLATEAARELQKIPALGMAVVNIGYKESVLPLQGFGYLVGKQAQEEILGVLFDSSLWPQHNRRNEETRLTVNIEEKGREEDWYVHTALCALKKHLNLSATPAEVRVKHAPRAIPQYSPGHFEKVKTLKEELTKRFPRCFLAGNYLCGVSVEDCIARAKQASDECLSIISH